MNDYSSKYIYKSTNNVPLPLLTFFLLDQDHEEPQPAYDVIHMHSLKIQMNATFKIPTHSWSRSILTKLHLNAKKMNCLWLGEFETHSFLSFVFTMSALKMIVHSHS